MIPTFETSTEGFSRGLFSFTYLKNAGAVGPRAHIYQLNKTSMKTFGDIQYDFIAVPKGPEENM